MEKHPALILSGAYLLLTILGVLYGFFFFREFGINYFELAGVGDFIVSALQSPYVFIYFVFYFLLIVAVTILLNNLRKTAKKVRAELGATIVRADDAMAQNIEGVQKFCAGVIDSFHRLLEDLNTSFSRSFVFDGLVSKRVVIQFAFVVLEFFFVALPGVLIGVVSAVLNLGIRNVGARVLNPVLRGTAHLLNIVMARGLGELDKRLKAFENINSAHMFYSQIAVVLSLAVFTMSVVATNDYHRVVSWHANGQTGLNSQQTDLKPADDVGIASGQGQLARTYQTAISSWGGIHAAVRKILPLERSFSDVGLALRRPLTRCMPPLRWIGGLEKFGVFYQGLKPVAVGQSSTRFVWDSGAGVVHVIPSGNIATIEKLSLSHGVRSQSTVDGERARWLTEISQRSANFCDEMKSDASKPSIASVYVLEEGTKFLRKLEESTSLIVGEIRNVERGPSVTNVYQRSTNRPAYCSNAALVASVNFGFKSHTIGDEAVGDRDLAIQQHTAIALAAEGLAVWKQTDKGVALEDRTEGVYLEGFADHVGPSTGNLDISELRAQEVARKLAEFGVPKEVIWIIAHGESRARADSAFLRTTVKRKLSIEELRQEDRRVDIYDCRVDNLTAAQN